MTNVSPYVREESALRAPRPHRQGAFQPAEAGDPRAPLSGGEACGGVGPRDWSQHRQRLAAPQGPLRSAIDGGPARGPTRVLPTRRPFRMSGLAGPPQARAVAPGGDRPPDP